MPLNEPLLEGGGPARAETPRAPRPGPESGGLAPEAKTPAPESYTNRLLKAKQRVWEEREKDKDKDKS